MSNDQAPASPEEGADEIFALLHTLGRQTARQAQHCGGADGLPSAAWLLLRELHRTPGQTVSGLARASGISKSRVSVLADALAARGLLAKVPDPGDQRILRLHLTEAAQGLGPPRFRDALRELVADLEPVERRQLLAALRRMREGALRRGW